MNNNKKYKTINKIQNRYKEDIKNNQINYNNNLKIKNNWKFIIKINSKF